MTVTTPEEAQKGRGRPRCEDTRRRILDAAAQTMEMVGFANATTDTIAERAGASKATIYRWWPNKEVLLAEALRTSVGEERPFPSTGDFEADIRDQLRNFAELINGKRGRTFRAFVAAAQTDKVAAEAFWSGWVQPRRLDAKAALQRYREDGTLPHNADLDLLLDGMYGPFYFRILTGYEGFSRAYADAVATQVIHGVWRRTELKSM